MPGFLPGAALGRSLLRHFLDILAEQMGEDERPRPARFLERLDVAGGRDPDRQFGLYRARIGQQLNIVAQRPREAARLSAP